MKTGTLTLEKIIGFILLIPPVLGVFFFLYSVFDEEKNGKSAQLKHLSGDWTGSFDTGGYTSAAPIYLGLMAIAGAILLSKGEAVRLSASNSPEKKQEPESKSEV